MFGRKSGKSGLFRRLSTPRARARLGKERKVLMALFKDVEVRKLLTDYNASVGEDGLDLEVVCAALTKAGGGVAALAAEMSYEDIAKANKLPAALARAIAKLWRGEEPKPKTGESEVRIGGVGGPFADFALAFGNVGALNDTVLLANYEPLGRADVIAELDKRGGGKPFVVFSNKQTLRVDVNRSFDCLQLLKQGVEIGATTEVNGSLVELFRPGEMPDLALAICPIHGCHLVGNDEHCPQCSRNWKGVSTEARELVHVHVDNLLTDKPQAQDPRLQQIFAALGNAKDPYWAQATLELEKLKATGQPIVLVKPVKRTRPGQQPSRR